MKNAARVFGFIAAEADVCVLIVNHSKFLNFMVRWDLANDRFETGQWISKEIDFAKSALSPDGKLFGYKVLFHEQRPTGGPPPGHYIVISCPPYFTALALWWTGDEQEDRVRWEANRAVSVGKCAGTPPDIGDLPEGFHILDPRANDLDLPRRAPNTWMDVDHRGRLLFVLRGRVSVRDADGERELIDLNPFEFRPLAPPTWATEWPPS